MRAEWKSGQLRYLLRGAHGRPANREIVKSFQHLFQPSAIALQQTGPSAKLLAYSQGHGILQVSAADLYHVFELFGFGSNGRPHGPDRGNERVLHTFRS